MSLLPFWVLNVSVVLLSMKGQKALGFHKKYLNLCSEEKRRSYEFGMIWGQVINDRIFYFKNQPLGHKSSYCWRTHSFKTICPVLVWLLVDLLLYNDLTKTLSKLKEKGEWQNWKRDSESKRGKYVLTCLVQDTSCHRTGYTPFIERSEV